MKKLLFVITMIVSVSMLSCNPKDEDDDKNIIEISKANGEINGHGYVNLGLPSGIKWATCNVGASSYEDNGNYYAWGEVEVKTEYTEYNSVTWGVNMKDVSGNAKYDVARVEWGSSWRLPNKAELEELDVECTWVLVTKNNVRGYKVTGPNGNSIFIPIAGYFCDTTLYNEGTYGYLWSSTPYENSVDYSYSLEFKSGGRKVLWGNRYDGYSIRPVTK